MIELNQDEQVDYILVATFTTDMAKLIDEVLTNNNTRPDLFRYSIKEDTLELYISTKLDQDDILELFFKEVTEEVLAFTDVEEYTINCYDKEVYKGDNKGNSLYSNKKSSGFIICVANDETLGEVEEGTWLSLN